MIFQSNILKIKKMLKIFFKLLVLTIFFVSSSCNDDDLDAVFQQRFYIRNETTLPLQMQDQLVILIVLSKRICLLTLNCVM